MIRLDKEQFVSGIWTTKDLAKVLDISPNTFSNRKEYWLGIIRKYVNIEEIGRGKYLIE